MTASERPTKEKSEWMSDRERIETECGTFQRRKGEWERGEATKTHLNMLQTAWNSVCSWVEKKKRTNSWNVQTKRRRAQKRTIQHFNKDNSNEARIIHTHAHTNETSSFQFENKRRREWKRSEMLVSKVYGSNNWAEEFIEWFALAAYQSRSLAHILPLTSPSSDC